MMIAPEDPRMVPIRLRKQLLAEGWTDRSLGLAVKRGELRKARRGAYVDGAVWDAMSTEFRYAVRSRAAYQQAMTPMALSHSSSLPFFLAPLWGLDLRDAHLTRLDARGGRREAGVCQHSGKLLEADTIELHGMVLTSPVRTALDMTTVATLEAALVVVCDLLHRRVVTIADLRSRYDGHMDHWPNSLRTDIILRLSDDRIESVGEARTLHFLWRNGFPHPELQYEVSDGAGGFVARLDFALPEFGIWIEFDGRIKYETLRRPGESITDVVLREKRREEIITELTGWRCLRVTWADLADPLRLAARIRSLMQTVACARERSGS